MAASVKRLRREAGDSTVAYVILLGALTLAVVYIAPMFTSINNTTKASNGSYTTVGGPCSQSDTNPGVFAKVAHAANCK
jgi:hypothetical protein